MRIPWAPREKACILFLRKKYRYSLNQLAEAFGRSVSLVHQVCKWNETIGNLKWMDNRCLPGRVKKIAAARMTRQLRRFMRMWQAWILGDGDRPP